MRHITDSEREDARIEVAEARYLRRASHREIEWAKCEACGQRIDIAFLENGICPDCKPFVEDIEEMCR